MQVDRPEQVFKSPDAHSAFLAGQKLVQSIGSGKVRCVSSIVRR